MSLQIPIVNTTAISALLKQLETLSGQQPTVANDSTIWPVRAKGQISRISPLGIPGYETTYHKALEQGRLKEASLNGAIADLRKKKYDLMEKLDHYTSLNSVATSAKLPHAPRVIKLTKDVLNILQTIQQYMSVIACLEATVIADLQYLTTTELKLMNYINRNLTSITTLVSQICNWNLPNLPSLPFQLGGGVGGFMNFGGFNFNPAVGFNFNVNTLFNALASFSLCIPRTTDPSSLFPDVNAVTTVALGTATAATPIAYVPPYSGVVATATQLADPTYLAKLATTTALVLTPTTTALGSLPDPTSIISNFSLPPDQYAANVATLIPALVPSVTAQSTGMLAQQTEVVVNLQTIAETLNPNVAAAWLFLIRKSRLARAGSWRPTYAAQYQTSIQPSLTYLDTVPVPFNNLGGVLTTGPQALPLLSGMTNNELWRLSYIEADLLGYPRNQTWDGEADATYLNDFAGQDVEFTSTDLTTAVTTVALGTGTASYPVSCTYPSAMGTVMAAVIAQAGYAIANNTTFQSSRAQFRYIFNEFSEAVAVDRYTQFWREFNANLQTLLAGDAYVGSFVANYAPTLYGAITPLADTTDYTTLSQDASTRNRLWVASGEMLTLPALMASAPGQAGPTVDTSGWSGDDFDSAAFLSRPDIQAQPLTVQAAMLRANQTYAALLSTRSTLQDAFSNAYADTATALSASPLTGWTTTQSATITDVVDETPTFSQVVFDKTNSVQTDGSVEVGTTGTYMLGVSLTAEGGAISATVTQNGAVILTADSTMDVSLSDTFNLTAGDVLVLHVVGNTAGTAVTGTFTGIMEANTDTSGDTSSAGTPTDSGRTIVVTADVPALQALTLSNVGSPYPGTMTLPVVDAVTTQAAKAGTAAAIVMMYGEVGQVTGQNWTPGALLYVGAGGVISTSAEVVTTVDAGSGGFNLGDSGSTLEGAGQVGASSGYIVVIGKALTEDTFIFQPQVPVQSA